MYKKFEFRNRHEQYPWHEIEGLQGWRPYRLNWHPPRDVKVIIVKSQQVPSDTIFGRDKLLVDFEVELSHRTMNRRVTFERAPSPELGTLGALHSYLKSKIGIYKVSLYLNDEAISWAGVSESDREALECFRQYDELVKSRVHGVTSTDHIKVFLPDLIHAVYRLGVVAREIELRESFEADVRRAKSSHSGAKKAALVSGARRTQHAKTWQADMARWLQPLIDKEIAGHKKGLSRDSVAKLAENNWSTKEGGFKGLYQAQRQCPERPTLINILKNLQKDGLLRWPGVPKGRPSQLRK